ncbi:Heat shock protein hsp88 [Smittium mucronatum]|uniref:Heat shock protein hsp88 n=1 Tax=Smittium mucronatum TaxID=133383 RepID=A0A1R0GUZ4_9FUNG|nr:Heat shock protein hsp88 [Smittium mucronatum]
MSVVGFDIGTVQSVIAVARNRGIDILTNEVSNRTTPSMVSFGPKQRYLGEMAKNLEMSNFKNTVVGLKRLIGTTLEEALQNEHKFSGSKLVDVDGEVGVEVNYNGQVARFSATQLYAMYLGRLRDTSAAELKNKVSDVVISVPGWYTDRQRRSVMQACQIADLNCLRLINDSTSAALSYGITKHDLPEDKPRNVVFVDMGHGSFSVAVVAFKKGELSVKATAYAQNCGGRDLDQVLIDHFLVTLGEKYKIDIASNPKAMIRLRTGCEKLKKMLSANPIANLNIENLMNDVDVEATIKREEFEELAAPILNRVIEPVKQALAASGLSNDEIFAIETVGGSIRVPAVKRALVEIFGRELSFTLNQDEAVGKGCAFQCAMLSPVFKVRDFSIRDSVNYPIDLVWDPVEGDDDTSLPIYSQYHTVPSTKVFTFYRREDFVVDAVYSSPEGIPSGASPNILSFKIKGVKPSPTGDVSIVKVKARLDLSGILNIISAYYVEEKEVEEVVPPKEGEEVDPEAEVKYTKVRKLVKAGDLVVEQSTQTLPESVIKKMIADENVMHSADELVTKTEHAKNYLEEYIYDTRSKLGSSLKKFISPEESKTFLDSLNAAEEWLYDEGDDSDFATYTSKLDSLKAVGDLAVERATEAELRPKASKRLRETVDLWVDLVSSNDDKYSHISKADKDKVLALAEKSLTWIDEQNERQSLRKLWDAPVLFTHQIDKEKDDLVHAISAIMNKPKPRAPTVESAPESAAPSNGNTPVPENDQELDIADGMEMD